ncbi:MAG: HAD family hydrolase [Flavobacteriales bacterium]|nr:HAD family hydrolase [Flavobacteriales bacterium]
MRQGSAVFLDRDGVINRERGEHTWRPEDVELLPDVAKAIRMATRSGHRVIVITNQSGVQLGLYTIADVERVHAYLHQRLAEAGAHIDAFFYCPHHPSKGRCLCRKPGSLLLERAMARFGIDPRRSVMIGDRERDVQAAEAAGVRGVLVEANASLLPVLDRLGRT